MRYLLQAFVALALLVGMPILMQAPSTTEGEIAAAAGAVVLAAIALRGVLGYVRSRKPKSYHDSIMPPAEPPRK